MKSPTVKISINEMTRLQIEVSLSLALQQSDAPFRPVTGQKLWSQSVGKGAALFQEDVLTK